MGRDAFVWLPDRAPAATTVAATTAAITPDDAREIVVAGPVPSAG